MIYTVSPSWCHAAAAAAAAAAIGAQTIDVWTEPSRSAKKAVFGSFPNFCCPEKRSGLNRISHPDWVKLCVELNYAPNKNTKIPSATVQYMQFPNI